MVVCAIWSVLVIFPRAGIENGIVYGRFWRRYCTQTMHELKHAELPRALCIAGIIAESETV